MKCYSCGTELPEDANFCYKCGEKQGPSRRPIFSDKEIVEIRARVEPDDYVLTLRKTVEEGLRVERRETAVLFADVAGFTPMTYALSPDRFREVMREVYSVMDEAIAKCGGWVDKFIGDEVMAIFGAPIALERPCDQAIAAADEIVIGLTAVNYRFKDIIPKTLAIHAGIAFGKVQAGRFGDSTKLGFTVLGETVNVAKRLTDAAPPGSVFVSKMVEDRASDKFEFESLKTQQFQGLKRPMEVFRLLGPRRVAEERPRFSQFESPMYGRGHEMLKLVKSFRKLHICYPDPQPCRTGEGKYMDVSQIFSITGDAGIGKSRLAREIRKRLSNDLGDDGFRWLSGSGWSIGRTPLYWPVRMQIASALGFEMDSASQEISKSLTSLGDDKSESREIARYLHHLFRIPWPDAPFPDLSPKTIKDNVWIAIRRLYARWAFEKPLVLVFENMHWADGGTIDFLDYLAGFVSDFPVIVLILSRPQFKPELAKRSDVPFSELALNRLSKDAERRLLDHYIRPGAKEEALIRRLRKFSDGNPLFIEEFLHLLLEDGKLKSTNGKMRLTENVQKMPVPAGVSAVLGQRIDRLEQREKRVAYYAAVIGQSFSYSLLRDIHSSLHDVDEVRDALDTLVEREIIVQKRLEPELEYTFKHASVREILLSRLVESLRRELSKLIATRVEKLYMERIEEFYGMLSEHWETARNTRKAARYAALCGIHNRAHQQNFEASAAFTRYEQLSKKLTLPALSPQQQEDVLLARIKLLTILGSYDDAIQLCQLLGQTHHGNLKAVALCKESRLRQLMGDSKLALSLGVEALDEASRYSDLETQAEALNVLGIVHANHGDSKEALESFEKSLSIRREFGDRQGIAISLNNIACVHRRHGNYDQGLEYIQESLSISRQLGDRAATATSLNTMGLLYTGYGDPENALKCYQEAVVTMRELGNRYGIAISLNNIGMLHHLRGDYDEALERYTRSLEIMRDLGDRTSVVLLLSNIGSIHADKGAFQKAMQAASEAEKLARDIGERMHLIQSLAILCRAYAGKGDFDRALKFGNEALRVSDEAENQEYMFIAHHAMAEAHLQMARWHDSSERSGDGPPLPHQEALRKASEFAEQAKQLAETKGMRGYLARAQKLLAEIEGCASGS